MRVIGSRARRHSQRPQTAAVSQISAETEASVQASWARIARTGSSATATVRTSASPWNVRSGGSTTVPGGCPAGKASPRPPSNGPVRPSTGSASNRPACTRRTRTRQLRSFGRARAPRSRFGEQSMRRPVRVVDRPPRLVRRVVFAQHHLALRWLPLHVAGVNLNRRDERVHGRVESVIDLGVQVAIGEDVQDDREPAQNDGEGGQEEHGQAVGEAHVPSPAGTGSPSTYPRPRTVWSRRGPWASSFLRSSMTWTSSVFESPS